MKKKSLRLLILLCITFLTANTFSQITVTRDNFTSTGWETGQVLRPAGITNASQDKRTQSTGFIYITCGPATVDPNPILHNGSAYLTFPKTANPELYRVILGNNLYQGKKLADITDLKYSTFTDKTPKNTPGPSGFAIDSPVAPILLLQIDMDGDGPGTDTNNINFFPHLQDVPAMSDSKYPVIAGKWQEWNTLNTDFKWKFTSRKPPVNPLPAALNSPITLHDFLLLFPHATIVNSLFTQANGGTGIRFLLIEHPYFKDYTGYIDGFTIKVDPQPLPDIYDFNVALTTTKTVCEGDPVDIGILEVPGNNYSWVNMTDNTDIITKTTATITVTPKENTTYIVTEKTPDGCEFKNKIVVAVNKGICRKGNLFQHWWQPWRWWWLIPLFGGLLFWGVFRTIKYIRNKRQININ